MGRNVRVYVNGTFLEMVEVSDRADTVKVAAYPKLCHREDEIDFLKPVCINAVQFSVPIRELESYIASANLKSPNVYVSKDGNLVLKNKKAMKGQCNASV